VERVFKKKDGSSLVFEASDVLERVKKMGDLFEPVLTLKQKLPNLAGLKAAEPEEGIELAAQGEEPQAKKSKTKKKLSAGKAKARKV
jgi:bifunctional non-homologous end joining protein LigD